MPTTLTVTRTTSLFQDFDGDGQYDPGDIITIRIRIENLAGGGQEDALNVNVDDTVGGGGNSLITFVPGSIAVTPIPFADSYSLTGNTPYTVSVAAAGILGNDTDPGPGGNAATLIVSEINGNPFTPGVPFGIVDGIYTHTLSMNADGTFTFTPDAGYEGTFSFTYTAADAGSLESVTAGVVSMTVSGLIWYVDSNGSDITGDGTYANPFATLAPLSTGGTADALDGNDDIIVVRDRGVSYNGGIVLEQGQDLWGDASPLVANGFDVTAITASTSNAVINHAGIGITLSQDNTIDGITLNGTAVGAIGIEDGGASVGTLTITNSSVIGDGKAIDIDQGGVLAVTLDTLSSTNSTSEGVQLAGDGVTALTGSFTATDGAITGAAADGFLIGDSAPNNGGTAAISYGGDITGGTAISVTGRDTGAGNVTFSGAVTATTSAGSGIVINRIESGTIDITGDKALTATTIGNGVVIANVSGGTINLTTGTFTTDTITGSGIDLTNISGGTINLSANGGIDIDVTGAGRGVSIAGISGGASAVNFTGGGLNITTADGTGFLVNNTGTTTMNLSVQGAGNSVTTGVGGTGPGAGSGGALVSLTNVQIGASNIDFDTLNATESVSGNAVNLFNVDNGTFDGGNLTIAGATNDGVIITSGSTANATFASATIGTGATAVDGDGIELDGTSGTMTFGTVDIDNVGLIGLRIGSNTNTVAINGGTIGAGGAGSIAGDGVNITGGNGNVTVAASVTKTTAGNVVEVNNHDGGTVTFSGNLSATGAVNNGILVTGNDGTDINFTGQTINLATGANAAVSVTTNTGSTIDFAMAAGGNGLDISTTSGAGFNATGGGTVTVVQNSTAGSAGNTIASTTGTALNISGTSIGAADATFQQVNASGGTNGIVLSGTGAAGGLTITGLGTTNGSGGTIQNTTGRGISVIDGAQIKLSNITLTNAGTSDLDADNSGLSTGDNLATNAAIHLVNVTNVTLDNVDITGGAEQGINGHNVANFELLNSTIIDAGNGADEDSIHFFNMSGTSRIVNTILDSTVAVPNTTGGDDHLNLQMTSGNLDLTITGGSATDANKGSGYLFGIRGTAIANINFDGATSTTNFSGGIVADAFDSATMNLRVNNSTSSGNNDQLSVSAGDNSRVDLEATGNILSSVGVGDFVAIGLLGSAFDTGYIFDARIHNNTIDIANGLTADGVFVFNAGGGVINVAVTDNDIDYAGTQRAVIFQQGQDGAATTRATVTGNNIDVLLDGAGDAVNAILATSGVADPSGAGSFMDLNIGGAGILANTITHSLGGALIGGDIRVRQRFDNSVNLDGYVGGATDTTAVATYLDGRNNEVSASTASHGGGAGVFTGNASPRFITVAGSAATMVENGGAVIFTFTRNGSTAAGLVADFSVTGTAATASDFAVTGATTYSTGTGLGTITFAAGSATTQITVTATNDGTAEFDETVVVDVGNSATANGGFARATITNDDGAVFLIAEPPAPPPADDPVGEDPATPPAEDPSEPPAGDPADPPVPPAHPVIVDDNVLTQAELDYLKEAAIQRWAEVGASDEQLAAMRATDVSVANMTGLYLGSSGPGKVLIDSDAAGYGWFLDHTPEENSEFFAAAGRLYADAGGPAEGRMDLLTVLMHELGHQIGLEDSYSAADINELMYGYASVGVRKQADADDLADADPAHVGHTAYALPSPVNIGTLPVGQTVDVTFRATIDAQTNGLIVDPDNTATVTLSNGNAASYSDAETLDLDSLTLGGTVWLDMGGGGGIANDGIINGTEAGIDGVLVTLFADTGGSVGIWDAGDTQVGISQLTSGGGNYSFTGLAPGEYIVRVDQDNFDAGGNTSLVAQPISSAPNATDPDAGDPDTDNDDNGVQAGPALVTYSLAITLDYNSEPTAGMGNDTNNTVDFGFVSNIPPSLVLTPANPTYNEPVGPNSSGGGVLVLTDAAIADSDDTNIESATITVSDFVAGDVLGFDIGYTLPAGISASYVPATGVLTLTGSATLADYELALENVRYSHTGDNPTVFGTDNTRQVTFTVNDGIADSSTVNASVAVVGEDDDPVNVMPAPFAVNEDDVAVVVTGLQVGDPDTVTAADYTVHLQVQHGTLAINTAGFVTTVVVEGNNGTNGITLRGPMSEINAAFAGGALTYTPDPNYNVADSLTVSTYDGVAADLTSIGAATNYATSLTGGGNTPANIFAADLDGDLDLDLLYSNNQDAAGRVGFRLNNGDGTFGAETTLIAGNAVTEVIVANLNGDAFPDIVVANYDVGSTATGTVGVFFGTGVGTFGAMQNVATAGRAFDVNTGDFDRDGDLDLFVARRDFGTVQVLVNNGSGVFSAGALIDFRSGLGVGNTFVTTSVTVGDFNNDGDLDVIAVNQTDNGSNPGQVRVALGGAGTGFAAPVSLATGLPNPYQHAVADLDGDGNLDIVYTTLTPNGGEIVGVLLGDGLGGVAASASYAVPGDPLSLSITDVNGDGRPDIVVAVATAETPTTTPDYVTVLRGNGDGTFQAAENFVTGSTNASVPESVATGDFDGDGDIDAATANAGTGNISVLLNGTANRGDVDTIAITVNAVNDAPVVLLPGATQVSPTILEDAPNPPGVTIATFLANRYSDAADDQSVFGGSSPGAFSGIAVVVNDASGTTGQWQYSTNGGASWSDIGAATPATAQLFNSSSMIRFLPAADFFGVAPWLNVRLIDNSFGAITDGATTVDLSAPASVGGTTPFSSGTINIEQLVNPVNDAPVLDTGFNAGLNGINEDSGAPVGAVGTPISVIADLNPPAGGPDNVTDVDNVVTGIALVGTNTANGTFYYSTNGGANWTLVGPVSNSSALLLAADANTRLYFQPNPDFSGTFSAITFRAWDQSAGGANGTSGVDTGAGGGSSAFSAATDTAVISVFAINDAPVIDLQSANGGTIDNSAAYTENGGPLQLVTFADLGITDVDNANLQSATVTITDFQATDLLTIFGTAAGSTVGINYNYNNLTGVMTLTGNATLANWRNALNNVSFSSSSDDPTLAGTDTQRVIEWIVNDGALPSATATTTLTITAVNDAPVNTVPGPVTMNEDSSQLFSNGLGNAIQFADADVGAANQLSVVVAVAQGIVTLADLTGLTVDAGANGSATFTVSGTLAALNAAFGTGLTYTPAANFNGADTITVTTSDLGNTGTGGAQLDVDSIAIDIDDVNDAPQVGDGTETAPAIDEDTPVAATVATLFSGQFSDPLDVQVSGGNPTGSTGDSFGGIAVSGNTSGGAAGEWQYFDGAWTDIGARSSLNALILNAATQIRFNPAPDYNGPAPFLIAHLVETGVGPVTTGSTIDLVAIPPGGTTQISTGMVALSQSVTAVNDAPVNDVPGNQAIDEDTTLTLTGASAISVDDVDAATLQVTISVPVGTLTLSGTAGLTFNAGANGSGTMTVTGTTADINAALDGLVFAPPANYNGVTSISITTSDQGATGSGGTLTDTDAVQVTVNSVNDEPVGADETVTGSEDDPVIFAAVDFALTDPNDTPPNSLAGIVVESLPVEGQLTLSGNPVLVNDFITIADITAGNFRFIPDPDEYSVPFGSVYASFQFRVRDDGGVLFGGVDEDQSNNVMSIVIDPDNLPPVANDDAYSLDEDTTLIVGGAGVIANDTDDGAPPPAQFTAGAILVDGPDHAAAFTFNADGTFSYTPVANYNGADTFTYKLNDSQFDSNVATVTLTINPVNDAPVTNAENYVVAEDTLLSVAAPGLVANDTDIDSPTITAVLVTGPAHAATFVLNADGSFDYQAVANYNGADSFTYRAFDGSALGNIVTVNLDVTPVDDVSVTGPDAFAIAENAVLNANLLGNDSDIDGPALAVTEVNGSAVNVGAVITLASGAKLQVNANGDVVYDTNNAFNTLTIAATGASNLQAIDSFTYRTDSGNTATVTITVNGLRTTTDLLIGTAGNDVITDAGFNFSDSFRLEQGGNDTANGLGGNDGFYFGAAYNSLDSVDGGTGTDSVALQGNYAAATLLGTMVGVENLVLLAGNNMMFGDLAGNFYDYNIVTNNGNVAAGGILNVIGGNLRAGEDLLFNGAAETDGAFRIFAGQGNDVLLGGAGNDGFFFGADGNLNGADIVNGGGGIDSIAIRGNYSGGSAIVFTASSMIDVETLVFLSGTTNEFGGFIVPGGFDYSATMADANVAAGQLMTVAAANLAASETLFFDGRLENDGAFRILSGAGDDFLYGGSGNDILYGGLGADRLEGSGGADTYLYRFANESTAAARDFVIWGAGDKMDLSLVDANGNTAANDAFSFIGGGAFTGVAGQLRVTAQGPNGLIEGDVNGDGIADFSVLVQNYVPVAGDFVL